MNETIKKVRGDLPAEIFDEPFVEAWINGQATKDPRLATLRLCRSRLGSEDERHFSLATFAHDFDRVSAEGDLIGKPIAALDIELSAIGFPDRRAFAASRAECEIEHDGSGDRDFLAPIGIAPRADHGFAPVGDAGHFSPAVFQLPGNAGERGVDRKRGAALRQETPPPVIPPVPGSELAGVAAEIHPFRSIIAPVWRVRP